MGPPIGEEGLQESKIAGLRVGSLGFRVLDLGLRVQLGFFCLRRYEDFPIWPCHKTSITVFMPTAMAYPLTSSMNSSPQSPQAQTPLILEYFPLKHFISSWSMQYGVGGHVL